MTANHPEPASYGWWVCDFPERPIDPDATFGQGCPACLLAAEAMARRGDFPGIVDRFTGEALPIETALDLLRSLVEAS